MKGVIGNGVPSKLPILMACRRLTISAAENTSKYAQMFEKYHMGFCKDITDYDGLADSIRWMKNNPFEVSRMVENAYQYGLNHYSSTISLQILNTIFEKLKV